MTVLQRALTTCAALGFLVGGSVPQAAAQATAQSGSDLYYNNCAACHGTTGKGDGPTGAVLKTRPADLTIIAKNSGGTFPAAKIYKLIDGRDPDVRGHGGPDMPVWGEIFTARGGKASVKPRIDALVRYLEMLQVR